MSISLDETDALLIKEGLTLLDSHFESMEIMDNKNLKEERSRIRNIIFYLNSKLT